MSLGFGQRPENIWVCEHFSYQSSSHQRTNKRNIWFSLFHLPSSNHLDRKYRPWHKKSTKMPSLKPTAVFTIYIFWARWSSRATRNTSADDVSTTLSRNEHRLQYPASAQPRSLDFPLVQSHNGIRQERSRSCQLEDRVSLYNMLPKS